MGLCFTLEWLALGVWVGGLCVLIGAVIPAVFNTFGGQASGGIFLTRAFEGYNRFVLASMVVLGAASCYRWWSGDPAAAVSWAEVTLLAVMVVMAGIIIVVLHPRAAALQAQAFALPEGEEKKAVFQALFRVLLPVRAFYLVNLVLGILLMGVKSNRSLPGEGTAR
jgi:uncharacterized membrane protein